MENKQEPESKALTLAQIVRDVESPEKYHKRDSLNMILNHEPPVNWVKEHPFIKNWKYIPIGTIETLLQRLFKAVRVEILREGIAFNGVFVVARLHYINPASNEWDFQDGIGACDLQTKAGATSADLASINKGAISMAFPIAESYAVKDAAEKLGKFFGRDLNRKDTIQYEMSKPPTMEKVNNDKEMLRVSDAIAGAKSRIELEALRKVAGQYYLMTEFDAKLKTL